MTARLRAALVQQPESSGPPASTSTSLALRLLRVFQRPRVVGDATPRTPRRAQGDWSFRVVALAGALLPALVCCATTGNAASEGRASPLDRALDSIRPAAVAADVSFLADDELAGRDTPSVGQRVAARYVRNRLERLRLEPGAEPGPGGGWFHLWTLHQRELSAEVTELALEIDGEQLALVYGEDFALHPSEIVDGEWEGQLVWCGSGSRRDMEGIELEGRWALCTSKGESRTRRRRRVAAAGGAGLIVISAPKKDETTAEEFAGWLARTARPVMRSSGDPDERPPVFWVSEEIGARLVGNAYGLTHVSAEVTWSGSSPSSRSRRGRACGRPPTRCSRSRSRTSARCGPVPTRSSRGRWCCYPRTTTTSA